MKVLAIDPGYERLGVAIIEKLPNQKETLLFSHCIQTKKTFEHAERLFQIKKELSKIIEKYQPGALSIEKLFFSKNQKTALLVAEARGVILATARENGLDVCEFTPNEIKVAVTGYGKSDKNTIINFLPRIIKIEKKIKHDDEYDAIAAGLTFFASSPLARKKSI